MRDTFFQSLNGLERDGFVKSVQRGTIALSAANNATVTITAVDLNNSLLLFRGSTFSLNQVQANDAVSLVRVELTNATTVTAYTNTAPTPDTATVSFEVVEFFPGIIRKVQRGTVSVTSTGTDTIAAVNTAKAALDYLGLTAVTTSASHAILCYLTLTNSTTVTGTNSTASAIIVGYQVAEFY